MSDDFTRRLEEAAAAHGRAATAETELSLVTASVIGKARRRRRVTASLTAVGAFAGAVVLGAGSLAIANGWGTNTADPASHFGAPTIAMSETPEPSPETSSPAPSGGLDEYPPLQASRGDGFPTSYEMRDWVWDYVGEGWSVQSFSAAQDPWVEKPLTIPEAVVYLASPEGDLFELVVLPVDYSAGLAVVSWEEDFRLARIAWTGDPESGYPGGSAQLDLTTGDVLPIVLTTPWGISSTVAPIAVSANGTELWKAWIGSHVRYYRYSSTEGWTVASVNDLEGIGDLDAPERWDAAVGAWWSESGTAMVVRGDGAAVLFEFDQPYVEGGYNAPTQVAVYDLDTDSYSVTDLAFDVESGLTGDCAVVDWQGAGSITYQCGYDSPIETVTIQGVSALGKVSDATVSSTTADLPVTRSGYVGYLEAPPRQALNPYCGC